MTFARETAKSSPSTDWGSYSVDFRAAAFFPLGHVFRSIYGKCTPEVELEANRILYRRYGVWGNFNYTWAEGRTETFHSKTRFQNYNLSVGGKYFFNSCSRLKLYFGLGINGAYVHVFNDSHYVHRHVNKFGVGGVVKTGIQYQIPKNLFVEFFADYLYQAFHFEQHRQVGGIKLGAGFGGSF